MIIDDALNMAYSYAATICQDSELCKVSQEFNGLAGETERTYITKSTTITSYSDIQNLLSKLNEKESVRKSKGVYYTPYDVVRFIVINSVKSAYGKLTPENIRREDIDAVPYKSFAAKKTVFDPTCGAGEYLLAALELKLDLLDKHYKRIPITVIHDTVTSIFGNDINTESIMITKLRIVLCILKRYGVDYIVGLAEKMRPNFLTYDYVVEEPGENKYDIIVGNPPYVEDFKSGLTLSKRYGNIYANVLINAAKQLSKGGSIGFIIPLSYISTPRMEDLREELFRVIPEQYILSYADRPDCLFDSVHQKLCILIGKQRKSSRQIFTGNYQYWYKEERKDLFNQTQVVRNIFYTSDYVPKLGTVLDTTIFKKITDTEGTDSVYAVSRVGEESVSLNRREAFWMKAYREKVDDPEYKVFSFPTKEEADYCYCLINSSLFWWYWICTSDCWHVSKELNGFRAPFNGDYAEASELAKRLMDKLEETKVFVGTKQTDYEYMQTVHDKLDMGAVQLQKARTHDLMREVRPGDPGGLSFGTDRFYQQLYNLVQVIPVERITPLQTVILDILQNQLPIIFYLCDRHRIPSFPFRRSCRRCFPEGNGIGT